MCGLLIQFTNGRIESHFSFFGSLAFLAFYRDWKVLITASLVVTLDHFFRGIFWPQSIFGEVTTTMWRTAEHAAWVVFEDLFLIPACHQSNQEMRSIAYRQALLEAANAKIQRDNEAKMHALVNGAVDGIVTLDQDGVIESLNKAFVRMFGYSEKELLGENASFLIDNCLDLKELLNSSKKASTSPVEILMQPRTGSMIPVEISISEVHLADRTFYTAIIRDVSERKEVELRVSEFYSVVSHELRTPLTSIRGALGLVEGGIVGEVSPEVLELVTIARSSSDRLIRLINDILDLGKIEAGKIELRIAPTTLSEIIKKTISGIDGYAVEKEVSVATIVDFDADMNVDADRLIQVLTNLLSNAIKFSDPGETVELKVARNEERIKISVIDHGIGIEDCDPPKLFTKFQQLDSTDSRKSEGTGLGLAISKAFVECHGGTIGVNSKKGIGSEFWFEIPLEAPQVMCADAQIGGSLAPPKTASEINTDKKSHDVDGSIVVDGSTIVFKTEDKYNGGTTHSDKEQEDNPVKRRPTVLIIEDDDDTRKIVGAQLRSIDLDCIEASNGASGMELAHACMPDLIVLDLGLPELDGFELVSMLRSEKIGSTALLVYSGRDLTNIERSLLSLGTTKHLTKSTCSMNEFLSSVKELLLIESTKKEVQTNTPDP
jgi:PAS domain S-box-containing protein